MQYQLLKDPFTGSVRSDVIKKTDDDGIIRFVPNDLQNSDWRDYQEWLVQGNQPLAAD